MTFNNIQTISDLYPDIYNAYVAINHSDIAELVGMTGKAFPLITYSGKRLDGNR